MKKIQIINGPNLNMLGTREVDLYGDLTLGEIKKYTTDKLKDLPVVELSWFQSNIEGEIINKIQSLTDEKFDALIINPAGYSHTSVAMFDALKILSIPIAEVHLTNVYAREPFRQTLLTAQAASIIMSGLGKDAYYMAAMALVQREK
jgi:3-dehydroquinate dehydratase-2